MKNDLITKIDGLYDLSSEIDVLKISRNKKIAAVLCDVIKNGDTKAVQQMIGAVSGSGVSLESILVHINVQ